jgi:hypothetical protein
VAGTPIWVLWFSYWTHSHPEYWPQNTIRSQ